jgi:membrane associated rhomboid family serine protease
MFLGPIFLPRVSVALSVLVWLAVQLFLDLMPGMGGGVAYSAHLGGFVTGLALGYASQRFLPLLGLLAVARALGLRSGPAEKRHA